MKRLAIKLYAGFLALLALNIPSSAVCLENQGNPKKLVKFEIEDQFKKVYKDDDFRGSLFLIIGSDKKGRQYNSIWATSIMEALKTEERFNDLKIFRVADMQGVPSFIRAVVRGKFPKQKSEWVALDWDGALAKSYAWEKSVSNIMIFDADGTLIHQTTGKVPDDDKLKTVLNIIRNKYKEPSPSITTFDKPLESESGAQ